MTLVGDLDLSDGVDLEFLILGATDWLCLVSTDEVTFGLLVEVDVLSLRLGIDFGVGDESSGGAVLAASPPPVLFGSGSFFLFAVDGVISDCSEFRSGFAGDFVVSDCLLGESLGRTRILDLTYDFLTSGCER